MLPASASTSRLRVHRSHDNTSLMIVLPSIDLRDGKVVRLTRGDYDRQVVYGDDPADVAKKFVQAGAQWIHMVDLDAAKTGRQCNVEKVQSVRSAVSAKIELGGGARDESAIRSMLDSGVDRVVVGSAALTDWDWFQSILGDAELGGKLALGLDARDGRLAVHGWTDQIDSTPLELAGRVRGSGLAAIVYTDIAQDGTLQGINIQSTEKLVSATDVPIIASGGVGSIQDIRLCRQAGCGGVIVGKAYYEGRIDLAEAIAEAGPQSS